MQQECIIVLKAAAFRVFQRLSTSESHLSLENCTYRLFQNVLQTLLKVRIHGAILHVILRAVAKLHRVSTPKIVARNIALKIAAVEFCPTSATLHATNFFVYPPSAAFRAIL